MKKVFIDLTILFILISFVIFLWFSKGLIFAGGEEGIPFYDLNKTFQFVSYSWQDISAGYPTQLLLNRIPYFYFLKNIYMLGIPNFLVQAIHFFVIIAWGSISIYFLLYETVGKELDTKQNKLLKFVPLIGAIFYFLNPFSMTQIWGRGLYMQFFPFALFPFFLLMFMLGLKGKNFIYGILAIFVSCIFAGAYGNPSYIFSQWILLLIYLTFYIIRNNNVKDVLFAIFYFIFLLIGWTVAHMWWIYPFVKTSSNQFVSALNNTEVNLGTLGVSRDYKLPSLLRLIHDGYFYRDNKYGESYSSLIFNLISWLTPLALFFSLSIFKKTKIFLFYCLLFFVSLFICLGSNFPTGWLFIMIFKTFPVFQAFRNPFEKFGVVLTLAYAPFFAIGLAVIANKLAIFLKKLRLAKIILLAFLFLFFGIFLWPVWTGQFAGGITFNPWVEVPDYYKNLNSWLNTQKDDGRIIHLPINSGDGVKYSGWKHSYQGIEPGEYLYDRPSIGKYGQPFKSYYKFLLDRFNKFTAQTFGNDPDFTYSEFKSDYFYQELAKLNVRYIILHHDIDPIVGNFGEVDSVVDYLKKQEHISKINQFGNLDVYRVDIPQEIKLIYSPDIDIEYTKINPTLYTINIARAKESFELYLLENFDSNWELFIGDRKIENHSTVFSYANKWKVDNFEGNKKGIIKYKPQDYAIKGMEVTKIVMLGLILLGILNLLFIKKWIPEKT